MIIRVKAFARFGEVLGKELDLELDAKSDIDGMLSVLCASRDAHDLIFDESGTIRDYVNILKGGLHIQSLGGVRTALEDGDEVAIFPPVTGG
ncbi:MAG: MoaD family protein [Methanosarcinales archaeon]|nr:MoaD family protein [Methanosarcinales archaeon]